MRFTHLDRIYWPELGATKGDLVEYYRALAPTILPHLRDRPFTLKQHYTVPRGPFRYVKDALKRLPFEESLDGAVQIDLSFLHRTIGKCGGMEVTENSGSQACGVWKWPSNLRQSGRTSAYGDSR